MEIETPTIDLYLKKNALEAARAHKAFRREYQTWLEAYKSRDVARIAELAKKRDLKARKASMAVHKADKFLLGLANMWELKY
jgi:hypothetical protein